MVRAAREQGLIEAGGGHAMAAGFSLMRRISCRGFRQFLHAQFTGSRAQPMKKPRAWWLDAVSSPARPAAIWSPKSRWRDPIGAGNPEPLLAFPDLRVAFADVVGSAHVKVRLVGGDGARLDAIAFRAAGTPLGEGLLKSRGRPSMPRASSKPTSGTAKPGSSCRSRMPPGGGLKPHFRRLPKAQRPCIARLRPRPSSIG